MDPRSVARAVAAGRVAFGLTALLAPRFVMRRAGETLDPPSPYPWWVRAVGTRDVVIGAAALAALGGPDSAAGRSWVQVGAAVDTVDAATAVLTRRDVVAGQRALTATVATAASVAGWWAAASMDAD